VADRGMHACHVAYCPPWLAALLVRPSDAESREPTMPAEPVTAEPKHPVSQLASFELARYRRELQHALKTLPDHAPVRELLQQRLAVVLAEQDERARIAAHANA
jgi:hypothetical protein